MTDTFDIKESVLHRTMIDSPEWSNHDYSHLQHVTHFTHGVDYYELDPDAEWADPSDHRALSQPLRWSDSDQVLHPELGAMDPYARDRSDIDDELITRCVGNIADALNQMTGVQTAEGFRGRVHLEVKKLLREPENQCSLDEVLARVVDRHAEIVDEQAVWQEPDPYTDDIEERDEAEMYYEEIWGDDRDLSYPESSRRDPLKMD